MSWDVPPGGGDEQFWREFLMRGDSLERRMRNVLRHLPHGPRCKLCAAPFAGAIGPVMRMIGKYPSDKNPSVCNSCFAFVSKHHGGAEIELTLLFADIRGSTTLAEGMTSGQFSALLNRFYSTASKIVFENEGSVDKFVGDEIVAMFFPMISGERHAARAIDAARELLRATGHEDQDGPWAPIGVGVHTGMAWVGAIGDDAHTELTAVGDSVNITARLASAAAAGEVLVTTEAATAAGLDGSLPRRSLSLKGKGAATEVVTLTIR